MIFISGHENEYLLLPRKRKKRERKNATTDNKMHLQFYTKIYILNLNVAVFPNLNLNYYGQVETVKFIKVAYVNKGAYTFVEYYLKYKTGQIIRFDMGTS